MSTVAIYLGSVMLAMGVGSPALGSVNKHSATLVFFGIILLVSALYADSQRDKKERA